MPRYALTLSPPYASRTAPSFVSVCWVSTRYFTLHCCTTQHSSSICYSTPLLSSVHVLSRTGVRSEKVCETDGMSPVRPVVWMDDAYYRRSVGVDRCVETPLGPPRSVCERPQGSTVTRISPGGVINVSVWRVGLRGAPLEDPM